MGFKSHPCTEEVIDALLAALRAEGASGNQDACRVFHSTRSHVEQLRSPWDPTWTMQALDGVVRQMNQGGFRHVVGRVLGASSCTPAKLASFRLESLTDRPDY